MRQIFDDLYSIIRLRLWWWWYKLMGEPEKILPLLEEEKRKLS